MSDENKPRFRFRRRIPNDMRGRTFATAPDFKKSLHDEVATEALGYVGKRVLDRILRQIVVLKMASAAEARSRAEIPSLLSAVESALEMARAVAPVAEASPETMIATKALVQLIGPLTELCDSVGREIRAQSERSICELVGLPSDGLTGKMDGYPIDSQFERWIPGWPSEPDHRKIVFSAIEYCDALGSREFRWLAVMSLLAGGETVTFRPGRTTVAFAIEIEAKRMREAAYKCNPGWAASAEEMAELDSYWPATPLESLVSPAD